ncbi:hypothetical protein L3Q82_015918, partial [Scortum barcoo]
VWPELGGASEGSSRHPPPPPPNRSRRRRSDTRTGAVMAELEIDQSNLPRVEEVCQCFAVLEDGALAHNLQEQEIEQYYSTNIQKNQLVQNDIRIAKRLQDEEEEQRAQQSALLRQASRLLEEQDFEYARIIQEEIQRCAEEAQRREQDDEEIAKRLQEEEEQRIKRRSRGQEGRRESKRLNERFNTAPPRRPASLHQPQARNYRSLSSRSRFTDELRDLEEERGEWDEDHCENDLEERRPRYQYEERSHSEEYEERHRSRDQDRDWRLAEARERRCSRSESVRLHDKSRHSNRDLARTWSYKDSPDKRVRFRDDTRSSNRQQGGSSQVWEMLGQVLRERGVPVRFGTSGAPLQICPRSRDSQVLHGSEVSYGESQPHQRVFQRAATASQHTVSMEISGRGGDHHTERTVGEITGKSETGAEVMWSSEQILILESHILITEKDEGVEGRESMYFDLIYQTSSSGAMLQPEPGEAGLDLGELRQVLQDEELALKLQEEEETLLRANSHSSLRSSYPERDFRVAQVAQDEEIARFMQKQEMKSKRRSRELEGPASWREHRAMISHQDRRAARDRQVQRERLDSEGLPSPTEDCSPDNQPPSPISTIPQAQQIKNIAEELDPTFQARRQSTEGLRVGQTGPTCQPLPMPHSGLHDFLEEPTFIPPTKRQSDRPGRTKPKEKKENCKQQ